MQFATNRIGHFALTLCLHDALAAADGARIVSFSPSGHGASPVIFENISPSGAPDRPVRGLTVY